MKNVFGKLLIPDGTLGIGLGLLWVTLGPLAEAQSWRTKTTPYFTFDYPAEWQIKEVAPQYVRAHDPAYPDDRWVAVMFQAGATNRESLFQTCQTLDRILLDYAGGLQKQAESINESKRATAFERLQVTWEGPHPGFKIGGKNIRISIVQNRGGFDEVLAWDQWITAVARTNGIYLLVHKYPRADQEAQAIWDCFLKSAKFGGGPVTSTNCP
jgi:hypothetical protein